MPLHHNLVKAIDLQCIKHKSAPHKCNWHMSFRKTVQLYQPSGCAQYISNLSFMALCEKERLMLLLLS